tara:strand:+ start:165 stop:569 length:405 start_codon:yes stop_codon:yes gene_type:complete
MLPFTKKDGGKSLHLIGLKLEEKGTIRTIRNQPALVRILETVGEIKLVEGNDDIFRIDIPNVSPRLGVRKDVYLKIERFLKQNAVYRTYNYNEARKSQVFLEPIELPRNVVKKLLEDRNKSVEKLIEDEDLNED